MTAQRHTDRRTVLKSIGMSALGAGLLSGTASTVGGRPGRATAGGDLEITASHDHASDEHEFSLNTDTLRAGWNSVVLDNQTSHTHFAYIAKFPQQALDDAADEGMDIGEFYYQTVTRPFQFYMDILAGKVPDPDDNTDIYPGLFPPWFADLTPSGGPGLTAGGRTSKSTMSLGAGTYVAECYVKNHENEFHSYRGMFDVFEVVYDRNRKPAPDATATLSLSSEGMSFPNHLRSGDHTLGVRFEDQQFYSNLVGHDAHLIQLDRPSPSGVNDWMNWADPTQFISDGSEPGPFLGGVQNIRNPRLFWGISQTAYVDVNLAPGVYAWVAEVPDPASKGLFETFTVGRGR